MKILDAVDNNLFEEYCKYYFDNILQQVTHEIYIFKDFEYDSIKYMMGIIVDM